MFNFNEQGIKKKPTRTLSNILIAVIIIRRVIISMKPDLKAAHNVCFLFKKEIITLSKRRPLASCCILAQTVNLMVFLYFLHLPILYCTGSLVVLDVLATVKCPPHAGLAHLNQFETFAFVTTKKVLDCLPTDYSNLGKDFESF